MKKDLLIFVFILTFGFGAKAQNVQFELNGKINYVISDSFKSDLETELNSYSFLSDSTSLRTTSTVILSNEKKYNPNLGFELNGSFTLKLSEKFSLSTGLGLNFISFKIDSNASISIRNIIRQDTISSDNSISNPIGLISTCDIFENSFSDFGELDRAIHQDILNLLIPIGLNYSIIPSKLKIQLGVFFQTPIYSVTKREYLKLQVEETETQTICRYEKIEERNTSGNGINNLQFGLNVIVAFEIIKDLTLEIGARKLLTNVFVKEEYQQYPLNNNNFKPLIFSGGISYKF